jgi:membrane-bound lytic murein transglycosylase D
MKKKFLSLIGICSLLFAGKIFVNSTTKEENQNPAKTPEKDSSAFDGMSADLRFAGQHVPLEDPTIKQRLDRELKVNRYWKPIASDLAQKASRYFPIIRPILKKNGIPDDFKYLPLVESGFSNMVSYSGAAGPWQIMPSTGRHYGLAVNSQIDERYHIIRSTEAACKIINDAYKRLKDWTLVAASFNKGLEGIKSAMQREHTNSYYKLHLNTQAQRYVFRILAVKEIMEHPVKYGYKKNVAHFYYSIPTYRIKISNSISNLVSFAKKQGITLKTLKTYNPWLKANRFDNPENKTYYLEIPKEKEILPVETAQIAVVSDNTKVTKTPVDSAENFINNNILQKNVYQDADVIASSYTVNNGEDINFVAQKFHVKPSHIVEWNHLKTAQIKKGDVLKIYLEDNIEETANK